MRILTSLCLAAAVAASAQTYIDQSFANGIPSSYTILNGDGQPMKDGVYKNLGNNPDAAWVAGSLSGHGRCALSPTRCPDGETQQDNWLITPAFNVTSGDAIIRWEARSLHSSIPESYRVMKRVNGGEWSPLVAVDDESYAWTMRSVKLDAAPGELVEVAFVAATQQGFILAIDNLYIGVPQGPLLVFENRTQHYVAPGAVTFDGVIHNHGAVAGKYPMDVKVTVFSGATQEVISVLSLSPIGSCESIEFNHTASLELGAYTYTISAEVFDYPPAPPCSRGGVTILAEDFVVCNAYPLLQVVDRCSGTWCNNCPMMGQTTERLKRIYGDQIVVVEAHINDRLANDDYTASYLREVRGVPALIPNHRLDRISYSAPASTDDFSASLDSETVVAIAAEAAWTADGNVAINTTVEFADVTDNAVDRYRVAYLLLGDYHDPASRAYRQQCSALSFNNDEYYYMPDIIPAELMYFENVPVNAQYAYSGVPASLPANISAGAPVACRQTLSPGEFTGTALRALAMVVDAQTGTILNASLVEIADPSDAPLIGSDFDTDADSAPIYYDLTGRLLDKHPASFPPGIYIINGRKVLVR